ncbi:MAG: MATE family efflux transporter [Alphaproteobacteria bacterium]|nr:MATE family efflux transporter [Alphaproteobacteria bacterium]
MRAAVNPPVHSNAAWRDELRATARLALPIVATQIAQVSIMTVDVLMLGWLGPAALAAGAVGANLFFMVVVSGFGICMATAPLVAQAMGRRRHAVRDARRSVRQGLWAAAIVSLPGTMVMWHAPAIFAGLRQEPAIAADAARFVDMIMIGLLPALGFMVLRQFTAALERPRPALVVQVLTFLVNAIGNYMLIFGHWGAPALGVVGSGLASAIANWFSFAALLGFVLVDRRLRRFHVLGRFWVADGARLAEIFRIGLPIAGTLLLEVSVFSAAVYVLGAIETAQLAAHQIAIQCAALTFMVPFGLAQAATVRVGLAAGAGDRAGVARAGWAAFGLGFAFMSATAVLMALLRWPIVGLFLDLGQATNLLVAGYAAQFLLIAALFQVFDGSQTIAMGALRGLKDTRIPMMIAAFGYWGIGFVVGCIAAFWFGLGGLGVWIGLALGLALVACLATLRFAARERLGLLR